MTDSDGADEEINEIELSDEDILLEVGVESTQPSLLRSGRSSAKVAVGVVMIFVVGLIGYGVISGDTNTGDAGDDSSDVETAADDSGADDTAAEPEPTDVAVPDGDAMAELIEGVALSADSGSDTAARSSVFGGGGPSFLLPWGAGFVALNTVYEPLLLPEFPEEVRILFSDEVVETVEASGATTVAEAQQILTDAGLIDEVLEVLGENPDLMAQLTAAPQSRLVVSVSDDGLDWVEVDTVLPGGADNIISAASNGTRLVIATQSFGDPYPVTGPRPSQPAMSVSVTEDLLSWAVYDLPNDGGADLPDFVQSNTWISGLAAGPDGWVAFAETSRYIDYLALLPEEIRSRSGGWGTSTDASGVTVEAYPEPVFEVDEDGNVIGESYPDGCCNPVEELRFTWEELGISAAEHESYFDRGTRSAWSAPWGGQPVATTLGSESFGGGVVATSAGFVAQVWGERGDAGLMFSRNGQVWEDRGLFGDGWIDSIAAVDNGVVAIVGGASGTEVWLGDPDATNWRAVAVPGLPSGVDFNSFGGSPASSGGFASIGDVQVFQPEVVVEEVVFEYEGFRITNLSRSTQVGYENGVVIVDIETGATLLDVLEIVNYEDAEYSPPAWIDPDNSDGITYLDPVTSDPIVRVPHDVSGQAWSNAWDEAMLEAGIDPNRYDEYNPDLWVIASSDGVNWFVEDLVDGVGEEAYYPISIAINGNVVVVGRFPGDAVDTEWTRYVLS